MTNMHENAHPKTATDLNGKKTNFEKDLNDIKKMTGELASDAAHMVQANASHYYDQGLKQVKRFEKKLESRIQNHPLQSVLIVAGIGLVLGALWNRR